METLKDGDPSKLGNWTILSRIGTGGMGQVYLGVSPTGVAAAVKVIHEGLSADETIKLRLEREVHTLQSISNPFVAKVLDFELDAKMPWVATEYVAGPTLETFVAQNGPLTEDAWSALASALIQALESFHSKNIVHRDIKPANIVLSPTGPVLIDFGIAKHLDQASITTDGSALGTPAWLSPEQIESTKVGLQSDLFSLASVLAFASTGEPPFGWGPAQAVIYRISAGKSRVTGSESQVEFIAALHALEPENRPSIEGAAQLLNQKHMACEYADIRAKWLRDVYPKIAENVVANRPVDAQPSVHEQKLAKQRSRRAARARMFASAAAGAAVLFAVLEVFGNISSLQGSSQQSSGTTGVASTFLSVGEIIQFGSSDCSYNGLTLGLDKNNYISITDARWQIEQPKEFAVFRYTCQGKSPINYPNIGLLSFGQKRPKINIDTQVDTAVDGTMSYDVDFYNLKGESCTYKNFKVPVKVNKADIKKYGHVNAEAVFQETLGSDFSGCPIANVVSANFIKDSAVKASASAATPAQIEKVLFSNQPANCNFVGAIIQPSSNLPSGFDKATADYINSNYLSYDAWAEYGPGLQNAAHDEGLAIKLGFLPEWHYVCSFDSKDDTATFSFSGLAYPWDETMRKQNEPGSIWITAEPWTKSDQRFVFQLNFYDKNLNKCGTANLTTDALVDPSVDEYARAAQLQTGANGFDSAKCPIVSLTGVTRSAL